MNVTITNMRATEAVDVEAELQDGAAARVAACRPGCDAQPVEVALPGALRVSRIALCFQLVRPRLDSFVQFVVLVTPRCFRGCLSSL